MNIQIRQAIAHFPTSFRLTSVDGLFPEGPYAIDVHESWSASHSGLIYTRLATFMHLPIISDGKWALRSVAIRDAEIARAISGSEGILALTVHSD